MDKTHFFHFISQWNDKQCNQTNDFLCAFKPDEREEMNEGGEEGGGGGGKGE